MICNFNTNGRGGGGMHVFIYMNMYYKRVNVYIHTTYLYCASLNTINPSYIRIAYIYVLYLRHVLPCIHSYDLLL